MIIKLLLFIEIPDSSLKNSDSIKTEDDVGSKGVSAQEPLDKELELEKIATDNLERVFIEDVKSDNSLKIEDESIGQPQNSITDEVLPNSSEDSQSSGEFVEYSPVPSTISKEPSNVLPETPNNNIPLSAVSDPPQLELLPSSIATVLSYTGAHGSQVNASPEDMEYNKISESYPQANFSSIKSLTTSLFASIKSSVTSHLQNRFDKSPIVSSHVSVTASSYILGGENVNDLPHSSIHPEATPKTKSPEDVPKEKVQETEPFEIIDGTTIFMNDEPAIPTKEPSPIVEPSMSSSASILTSKTIFEKKHELHQNNKQEFTASQIIPEPNVPNKNENDTVFETHPTYYEPQDENIEIKPTHVPTSHQYSSLQSEILPSMTLVQESMSEKATPVLEETIYQTETMSTHHKSNIDNNPTATEMENQHVSTISINNEKEISTDQNLPSHEPEKTPSYLKENGAIYSIENSASPKIQEQNFETQMQNSDVKEINQKGANNQVENENEIESVKLTDENATKDESILYTSEEFEDEFEEFEDDEDTDDYDDEALDSEDDQEERKKIVEENLNLALQHDSNVTPPVLSATNDRENKDIAQKNANNNLQPPNGQEEGISQEIMETASQNEEEAPQRSSTDSSNEALHNDHPDINENIEIQEKVKTEYNIHQVRESDKGSRDTVNTLPKPGDNIKFYEPGDVLPTEINVVSSKSYDFQNGEGQLDDVNSMRDDNSQEGFSGEEPTEGKIDNHEGVNYNKNIKLLLNLSSGWP